MNLIRALSYAGIRGVSKSVYYSLRHTGALDKVVIHSKSITRIAPTAELNIENRLIFGCGRYGVTHPRLTRSLLHATPGSSITHTGTHAANIGPGSVLYVIGDFEMGDSFFNSHAKIICEGSITIGDGVAIGWDVHLMDDNRHQLFIEGEEKPRWEPITIEDNVWIGHSVSIKKGTTIGEGAVIASISVVTSDVPPGTLAAGAPAEVIEDNVIWK